MAKLLTSYHASLERLDEDLKLQAEKLANELIDRGLYPEHVAVPLAVNAVKNWARLGWLE